MSINSREAHYLPQHHWVSCSRWTPQMGALLVVICNGPLHRAGKGGNPELIRESQRRRYADPALVDKVIALDNAWRDGILPSSMCLADSHACKGLPILSSLYDRLPVLSGGLKKFCIAAVYHMEGLKRDANTLNKEIGTLRKVLQSWPPFPVMWHQRSHHRRF